jgi:hypothetical protein
MNTPNLIPGPEADPPPQGHWLKTLGKVLLWLCAIAVVLIVLVFGTCLLMLATH